MNQSSPLNLVLTGAKGKMSQAIQALVQEQPQQFKVIALLGRSTELDGSIPIFENLTDVEQRADILIDFSRPEFSMKMIAQAQQLNISVVSGTTGLSESQMKMLQQYSQKIPLLWASNMSVGVNLAFELVRVAAKIMGSKAQVEIEEKHHKHKVDAPSGTAITLGENIANSLGADLSNVMSFDPEQPQKQHPLNSIGFNVYREGDIVGEHEVSFTTATERLQIKHQARDRKVFAEGALRAAQWLKNQPNGFYNMKDALNIKFS